MKLTDAERNNRLEEVFFKKSDRTYYDLEITEDHQNYMISTFQVI